MKYFECWSIDAITIKDVHEQSHRLDDQLCILKWASRNKVSLSPSQLMSNISRMFNNTAEASREKRISHIYAELIAAIELMGIVNE